MNNLGEADALAVFHGLGAGRHAAWLRPGFRHCFAALKRDGFWIVLDGRRGQPELDVVAAASFDLAGFYRRRGMTVVELRRRPARFANPVAPATCVSAVKRLLGVRAAFAMTPYQLYRRLKGES